VTTAVENHTGSMRRSRASCQAMLALDHVLADDLDQAACVADAAHDDADRLASSRVAERMRPLHTRSESGGVRAAPVAGTVVTERFTPATCRV
jgi:hypothetical protein